MSKTIEDPKAPFVPNYLLYLLAAASEAASARFHSHVRTRGLRVPEWRVMACLTDTDGSMVTELARYAMIEQSRLTKIIIQMDARGLVSRRSDPKDGRRVRVFLTPQGRTLADELVADARAHELELLKSFQGGDGTEIKDTLRALIRHLESDQPDQADGTDSLAGSAEIADS